MSSTGFAVCLLLVFSVLAEKSGLSLGQPESDWGYCGLHVLQPLCLAATLVGTAAPFGAGSVMCVCPGGLDLGLQVGCALAP